MSYYCKGVGCHRKDECERHLSWRNYVDTFKKPDVEEGFKTGIWFVPENTCIKNNYEDGVFFKQINKQQNYEERNNQALRP